MGTVSRYRVSAKIQQLLNTLKKPKRRPLNEFYEDDELVNEHSNTLRICIREIYASIRVCVSPGAGIGRSPAGPERPGAGGGNHDAGKGATIGEKMSLLDKNIFEGSGIFHSNL